MDRQEGRPAARASGIGLGLGIGVAAGLGGVVALAASVVGFSVLRGRTPGRADAAPAVQAPEYASPSTPPADPTLAPPPVAQSNASGRPAAAFAAQTLYLRTAPAVVRIEVRDDKLKGLCTGTGFFVSGDGLLVTNYHVIDGGAFATVETTGGTTLFVEGIAAADKTQDLALLKVAALNLPHLALGGAERPPIGTRVFAIGHPLGVHNAVLSEGLVSGVGVALGEGNVPSIQTTAPISHGSSGGPLVTPDGEVVGVIAATARDAQNLNFAVPVALVRGLLDKGKAAAPKPLASAGGSALDAAQAAVLRRAWAAIDAGDVRGAASVLAQSKPRMRDSVGYWATAGSVNMTLQNYAAAGEAYQNVVRLKPDAVDAYASLGYACAMQEKYREAVKAFEAASRLAPREAKYYASAGRCYMETKQPDRAVAFYKKAIQLSPGDAAYVSRLGDAYAMLTQYADAVVAYEKALKLNASDADTHVALAAANYALRRPEEAMAEARKGLSLNPRLAAGHGLVGMMLLAQNDLNGALGAYQTAARLDPAGEIGHAAAQMADAIQKQLERQQAMQQQAALQQQQPPAQPQPTQRGRVRIPTQ